MDFSGDEDVARQLDAEDPLRGFRENFSLPLGNNGKPVIYFAGNSLGLMPKSARQIVEEELDNWGMLGVDAHDHLRVVMIGAVNFFTGQLFDIEKITAAAQKHGIVIGFDLAHAAGNVSLALHDCDIDFAVWCSYKYLNAGPGAVAGAFVHERHAINTKLPRLAGWFGNDPNTRFRLHLEPEFVPVPSADGWQISNPPIFSMAPLRASLAH